MAIRLHASAPDFELRFHALLTAKREMSEDVDQTVRQIIADVRARGDAVLGELTLRFDRINLGERGMRISEAEIDAAFAACDKKTLVALELARDRLGEAQEKLLPADHRVTDTLGVESGVRWTPVESAGLYVPGGTAAYPSSVLMNAVPARVAGCERLAMTVPTPDGVFNPLVLVAARLAGIDEIYRIGGAQAIAALAFGTETIAPVVKIVGPGNAYVAAAKRQVFGAVGIDMIAGPSEILVVADGDNDPDWIAADLLAQAEHDSAAQSILITDDGDLADAVAAAVDRQLAVLPRVEIAAASWRDFGAMILVESLTDCIALIDRLAAEHVELAVADPDWFAARIKNAGALFLGRHTPEVIGDYVGGSNHVLPTARSARFASGLSVLDFMKRTSILRCSPDGLRALAPAAITLAQAEGLDGHARSVAIRLNL